MIYGVGNDIVEINRVKKAIESSPSFLARIFTENERKRMTSDSHQSYAGVFAAKEAVSKALGTGFSKFLPEDIEVLKDGNGKPYVVLHNAAKAFSEDKEIKQIHVSISHSEKYAAAVAVAEN